MKKVFVRVGVLLFAIALTGHAQQKAGDESSMLLQNDGSYSPISDISASDISADPDLQARVNAFQKKLILRGRMEIRAITKEEYNREAAPLDDIIQYPGILTNGVNPEQVISPDIREQVDAFKKNIILQREYQRSLITSEEFSRQSDVLNGIMQRPVQWMTVE